MDGRAGVSLEVMEATEQATAQGQLQSQALSLGANEVLELPGYQLLERLGRGSFGDCWSALQQRTGQRVAVKICTDSGLNLDYLEREVARLRKVAEHPHVVTLLDADFQHHPPYFVMSLLQGSLSGVQASPEQALGWLDQVASALEFTHARGLLHCDLKPANLLLDEEGRLRLSDFGQALARGQSGHALGSLGFMCPEQAAGQGAPEVSWDMYALGATFYVLLTGQLPRLDEQAREWLSTSTDSSLRLARYQEFLQHRPLVPLRQLNPSVDQELAALIESCLSLRGSERPPHMASIREDLRRRRRGQPLLCRQPWSRGYRMRRFVGRYGRELGVLGMAALGFLLVGKAKLDSDRSVHQLMLRQQWQQGWNLYESGHQHQAMAWWARAGGVQPLHNLVLRSCPIPLLKLEKDAEPSAFLAYSSDGRQVRASCHSEGPYAQPVARAGLNAQGLWISRAGRLQGPQGDAGASSGALLVSRDGLLFQQGSNTIWQDAQGKRTTLAGNPPSNWEVGALQEPWAALAEGTLIRRWGLPEAKEQAPLALSGEAASLAIDPSGAYLACAERQGQVSLWELSSGRQVAQLTTGLGAVAVRFSPDGKELLASNYAGQVWLLEVPSGRVRAQWKHRWLAYTLSFSPSGRWCASGSVDGTARVFEVASGEPAGPFLEHGSPVRQLVFDPKEKYLASASLDGYRRTWLLNQERIQSNLCGSGPAIEDGLFLKDGQRLVLARGEEVLTWNFSQRRWEQPLKLHAPVSDLALGPEGLVVAAGSEVFSAGKRYLHPAPVAAVAGSFSVDRSGQLYRFEGGQLHKLGVQIEGEPAALEVSKSGQIACASRGEKGEVILLSPQGQVLTRLRLPSEGVVRALWSSQGDLLVCGERHTARCWSQGEWVGEPMRHALGVWDGAWSPDGSLLATASGDSTARVWTRNGQPVSPAMEHSGPVTRIEFSPSGEALATACKDGQARLWDSRSGQLLMPASQFGGLCYLSRFSPDGQSWLSGARDGSARLLSLSCLPLDPVDRVRRVEKLTGLRLEMRAGVPQIRPLSLAEWLEL